MGSEVWNDTGFIRSLLWEGGLGIYTVVGCDDICLPEECFRLVGKSKVTIPLYPCEPIKYTKGSMKFLISFQMMKTAG